MTQRIPLRYAVALQGFSEFERQALDSFFRLAVQRSPAYMPAEHLDGADFVIGNADSAEAVATIRQADRMSDTVFIGSVNPAGAVECLARPIAPTMIVRQLDQLLSRRLATLEPDEPDWPMTDPAPLTVPGELSRPEVLVVEDSRVAARFLQVRLQSKGYRVHLASTPEEALAVLKQRPVLMAFVDIELGASASMDGLCLCQRIKQHPPAHADAPKVALVTALASSSDKVRGALAGCDEYLTKPVMGAELDAALLRMEGVTA